MYAVAMGRKLRYEIDLTRPARTVVSAGHGVRSITSDDIPGLSKLMLDAYIGTIDYDDEDLDDAVGEVRSYFENGHPLLDRSYLVESQGPIVSAVLVSLSDGMPFIGYVMTAPDSKNLGLGRLVTTASLVALAQDGYEKVVFYITEGNRPSEALFRAVGAVHTPAE
jgi:predicted GNAT family acetyltransferase